MAGRTWTVKEMLDWCEEYLSSKGDENPRVCAQSIVSHVADMSRIELFMNFDKELTPEQLDTLRPLVKRRGAGEPLQYILGVAPFRYLDIKVRPGVLIPRPETEVLVSEVLAALPPMQRRVATDSQVNEYEGAAMIESLRAAAATSSCDAAAASGTDATATSSSEGGTTRALVEEDEFPDDEPAEQHGEAIVFGSDRHVGEVNEIAKSDAAASNGSDARAANDSDAEPANDSDARAANDSDAEAPQSPAFDGFLLADICTGSGCIACSIATERPDVRVIATDLSDKAVALAKENVISAGVVDRVGVLQGDLGTPIELARPAFMGAFDAIVSNPPYIPSAVLADLPNEVAGFEPELALDGGDDGLLIFRRLTPWALRALKSGGIYACELHETCLGEAASFAEQIGFSSTRIVNDLTGRPRVLICRA